MGNCMGKRKVKKMSGGGKPNLEAMGEKVTPPVNLKREKEKQLRMHNGPKESRIKPMTEKEILSNIRKKRYEVEKDMPAKKLADMADRARRRATGSQAKMQEMGSVTEPRTAKSKLKRRFGADTSKEDYGRKASGGSVKKMSVGGVAKAKKGRRGDGICSRGRTKGRMV